MKKILAVLFAVLTVFAAACSAPQPETAPDWEVSTPEPEVTVEPAPEPTAEPNRSLTTGMPAGDAPNYRPVTVMVENSGAARPQTGIQQADIVYECLAEGGITRFMCLFNDEYPVEVGPVRSARIYYINLQKEWDSVFCHFGGPSDEGRESYVYGSNTDYIKVRLDGIGKGGKYYWRSDKRSAPHNVYTDITRIVDEKFDYEANAREHFAFADTVDYEGNTISSIALPFISGKNQVEFKYDAETGKLLRWNDGEKFMVTTVTQDENGKKSSETSQLSVQNLIVQYANVYTIPNDVSGRRNITLTGSGKAEYVVGGKHMTGTWQRETLDDVTQYFLDDGTPLTLLPGNTWIAVHPDSASATVNY